MPERLEGRVTAVRDNKEVRINAGQDDGVEVGMRFQILDSQGKELGLIKIVEVAERSAAGLRFDSFVGAGTLPRVQRSGTAIGAGIGAAVGVILAGEALGGALGAIVGGRLGRGMARPLVSIGMRVTQVVGGEGISAPAVASGE